MADAFIPGEFLRSARGLTVADGAGVTWAFDKATNRLSVSALSGTGLAADSVTNVELANMAQATIKGRAAAAGTGDPTDLTAAQVKTILALTSTDISNFDEAAQDAVLNAGTDSTTINFTYNDGANTWTVDVIDDSISDAKLRNSAALSLIGRSANSIGDPGDISAGSNDTLLRRTSNTLNFGQLTAGMFPATVVPDAALSANVPLLSANNTFSSASGQQTFNATSAGQAALRFNSVGAFKGLVGLSGAGEGDTSVDMAIFSEAGIRFFAGGSAVEAAGVTTQRAFFVADGISVPDTVAGYAQIYVDTADGDLKVKFGDGTVKTLATDT